MSHSTKNVSISFPLVTVQELDLYQIFTAEGIPFEFQKKLIFPDRSYVVDYFLAHSILLECSYTRSYKYEVALRHKAILLEAKTAFIKQYHSYSMWVLFESERPIGEHFFQTLQRLMPSVDKILTSREKLRELLWGFYRKNMKFNNQSFIASSSFPAHFILEPSFDAHCKKNSHDSSTQNSCPYIMFVSSHYKRLTHQSRNFPLANSKSLFNNYSHKLKKNFTKRSEVFLP